MAHVHRNLGHASNRTMVSMPQRAESHSHFIAKAKINRCEACDSLMKKGPKPVVSSAHRAPGKCMELDNLVWQRPSLCMLDVGSKLPIIWWHNDSADPPPPSTSGTAVLVNTSVTRRSSGFRTSGRPC